MEHQDQAQDQAQSPAHGHSDPLQQRLPQHDDENTDLARQIVVERVIGQTASRVLINTSRNHPAGNRVIQPSPFQYYNGYQQQYCYYDFASDETAKFIGIIPWTVKILRLMATACLLWTSSIMWYGIFYWMVMPGNFISRPLFFDYTGTAIYPFQDVVALDPEVARARDQEESKKNTNKFSRALALLRSSTKTVFTNTGHNTQNTAYGSSSSSSSGAYIPWATVDFFAREQAVTWGNVIHPELMPPLETKDRMLQPKQAYYVEVHLTLPESTVNQHIGMFGVAVDLLSEPFSSTTTTTTTTKDHDGTKQQPDLATMKLASSVRSTRLPHESGWIAMVRKMLWTFPILFGAREESQTVIVNSFRHIVESQDFPMRHAVVRLMSQMSHFHLPRQTTSASSSIAEQQQHQHQQQPHDYYPQNQQRNSYQNYHQYQQSPQPPKPPVEVISGEIRIGKELLLWQQVLKDRYYLCYAIGTLLLFGVHIAGWLIVQYFYFSTTEHYGEPYFDPSVSFDEGTEEENVGNDNSDDHEDDDDDDFVSLQSGNGTYSGDLHSRNGQEKGEDAGWNNGASGFRNHNGSNQNNFHMPDIYDDDRSEDWEACPQNEDESKESVVKEGNVQDRTRGILVRRSVRTSPERQRRHIQSTVTEEASHLQSDPALSTTSREEDVIADKQSLPTPALAVPSTSRKDHVPGTDATEDDCGCFFNYYETDAGVSDERPNGGHGSPPLLASSCIGCSGSTVTTQSPIDEKNCNDEMPKRTMQTALLLPPLPEVKFTSSHSLDSLKDDTASTPACVLGKTHAVNRESWDALIPDESTKPIEGSCLDAQFRTHLEPIARKAPAPLLETSRMQSPPLSSEDPLSPGENGSVSASSSLFESLGEERISKVIREQSTLDVLFHLPEAQVLDSFLHDLISPFVR